MYLFAHSVRAISLFTSKSPYVRIIKQSMMRRRALLGTITALAGLAGCSGNRTVDKTSTPIDTPMVTPTSSDTPIPSPEPPNRETPSADFTQEWSLDESNDWTERQRVAEHPDSDEAVDWTIDYARSAEYAHVPSRQKLASAVDAPDVPPLICAVSSKWALSTNFSGTPVDLVAEVRNWFESKFEKCTVSVNGPENVEPFTAELESGRTTGLDRHEAEGDTGRLDSPFRATIDGESVKVERVSYMAEGVLLGLLGPKKHVGYLVGGAWPSADRVVLHTVENGNRNVSATVSGETWGSKDTLVEVLNDLD